MTASVRPFAIRRAAMAGAVLLASTAWPAFAQDQSPPTPPPAQTEDEIVVSGYRASLQSSTDAKRNSTGFTDTIFAEDIGKFPDTNIAESFNRIPGITISREITGEGLNVTIRGLGTNFTRVLLNDAPVAIASTGRTDAQNTNREVDLDMFPTELFTQLTVNKSSMASMIEGGAAGTINMRSARPFDQPGTHVTWSGQATKSSEADKWGYRGSLLASHTFGEFGVLVGVSGVHNQVRVTGFETIGWANPNLNAAQCGAGNTCNATAVAGQGWSIPGTVPTNAGIPNVAAGATIDRALLLQLNPGATIQQIDNGLIPRLGRPSDEFGTKDRINAIASLEYQGDGLHIYVDGMYGWKDNQLERIDMNWIGRNGASIPTNLTFDRSDCTAGCVVTGGKYYNAQFFLEYRPHLEKTEYWGINPGIEWDITDRLRVDLQGNWTESNFHRESPTVLVVTRPNSGVTVDLDNRGLVPVISATGADLNNPASFGWQTNPNFGGRVNMQDEKRWTHTRGVRGNLEYGDTELNVRFGAAYDDTYREIQAYDASQLWQNAVCGRNPNVFLPGPNTQPACNGLISTDAPIPGATDPTYPGYGTGFSQGFPAFAYSSSLVPNGTVPSFLLPGPSGFVTVDWEKFKAASNYDSFHDRALSDPLFSAGGANTGASAGYVREKVFGAYTEVNGDTALGDGQLRYNAGIRYVRTNQTIGGRVTTPDPRNVGVDPDGAGPLVAPTCPQGNMDGGCYPNVVQFIYLESNYENWLPSATAAYAFGNAVARASVSRTMTRPNPNAMLPGLSFTSPSANTANVGNPTLAPFISDNIDVGFEYYTGKEGYIGFAAFRKAVTGFTVNQSSTVPFSTLAPYGVTFNTLTPTQQDALRLLVGPGGDPNSAPIQLNQQVNASGTLKVMGLEFNWVQPLDFITQPHLGFDGLGFSANLTLVEQKGTGAAPAVAVGVAPVTYNITAYYEKYGISARLSTTFTQGSQSATAPQNNIAGAGLFTDDYQQWDFSGSLDLAEIIGTDGLPEVTLDVINLFGETQRAYFQYPNATFTYYEPGTTVLVGLRGRF